MYRRVFTVAVLVAICVTASASAATSQHYRFHGTSAVAEWFRPTSTGGVFAYLEADQTNKGHDLFADLVRFTDAGAYVETTVQVTGGFSFSIDSKDLTTASVSASGVPARRCRYDDNGERLGCNSTTVSLSAHWNGVGSIGRDTFNDHFSQDGFKETFHSNGISRNARASGTIAGTSFSAADLDFAFLSKSNTSDVTICHGTNC
jgi:hypothetical protein